MRMGTLCGVMFMLFASVSSVAAQPVLAPSSIVGVTQQQVDVKTDVSTAKADIKTSAATREQIQALRLALRAKLAALRH
jgi:hypothetical protein